MKITKEQLKKIIKEELEEIASPVEEVGSPQDSRELSHREMMNKIHTKTISNKVELLMKTLNMLINQGGKDSIILKQLRNDVEEINTAVGLIDSNK